jgi:hypothetical protein
MGVEAMRLLAHQEPLPSCLSFLTLAPRQLFNAMRVGELGVTAATFVKELPRRLFSVQPCVFFLCMAFLFVALGITRAADDADTLTLEGVRFRLEGIDAPEPDQLCLDSAAEVSFCDRKVSSTDAVPMFIDAVFPAAVGANRRYAQ